MTVYGLTDQGFVVKPLEVIRSTMIARMRGRFGPTVASGDANVEGFTIGIVSNELAVAWETLEDVWNANDVDANGGAAQDQTSALLGILRNGASESTVMLAITGDPTTNVLEGFQSTAAGVTPPVFGTEADAMIAAVDAWAGSHTYALGAFVHNAGDSTARVYVCYAAGVSAASGGPAGVGAIVGDSPVPIIVDGVGALRWRYVGDGTGVVQTLASCTVTGDVEAPSGSLVVPVSFQTGVLGVINLLDASTGADVESDEQFRVRREQEIADAGAGTVEAIRARLEDLSSDPVSPVTSVTVFNNDTDLTDPDGVPPHSIECLVEGGDDQTIRDVIRANIDAGIGTHGNVEGLSVDSEGVSHIIRFSRPSDVNVYVIVTLQVDPKTWPIDGADKAANALLVYGVSTPAGTNVVASRIVTAIMDGVPGVLDAAPDGVLPLISAAPTTTPTTSTTIQISNRQRAKYDSSRITIIATNGTV